MLLKREITQAIEDGRVTLAFRRWARVGVKPGSRLRSFGRVVEILAVDPIALEDITSADAIAAGATSREALLGELGGEGTLFRIALRAAGADPRETLRETPLDAGELDDRLNRLDRASRHGAWTREVLKLIADRPAVRAAELAQELGRETLAFKRDVRKLKELGLTESLDIGYRLSPRAQAFLAARS